MFGADVGAPHTHGVIDEISKQAIKPSDSMVPSSSNRPRSLSHWPRSLCIQPCRSSAIAIFPQLLSCKLSLLAEEWILVMSAEGPMRVPRSTRRCWTVRDPPPFSSFAPSALRASQRERVASILSRISPYRRLFSVISAAKYFTECRVTSRSCYMPATLTVQAGLVLFILGTW